MWDVIVILILIVVVMVERRVLVMGREPDGGVPE